MLQKQIVEGIDTQSGRLFDFFIQVLIVYSLLTFSVSTIPDLSDATREFLFISQVFTVSILTIEYLLRIFVADKKSGYIFSFYGIVDFLAILPFYLTLVAYL